MTTTQVRHAAPADADVIAHLLTQLGYPTTASEVPSRLDRLGAGRALVEAVEAFARASGCERLSVTTQDNRHGARAFYPRAGLEETGRRFGKALTS